MKKWISILVIILMIVSFAFILRYAHPSNQLVSETFIKHHPNSEVIGVEKLFECDSERILTYSVKYKEPNSAEIKSKLFGMQQSWLMQWSWRNNHSENYCE